MVQCFPLGLSQEQDAPVQRRVRVRLVRSATGQPQGDDLRELLPAQGAGRQGEEQPGGPGHV